MVTEFSYKDLVMKSRDTCFCGPLEQCVHDRASRPTTMKEWLTNVQRIEHVQNKQGRVYFCNIRHDKCVVKHFNKSSLVGHVKREILSGQCLNAIRVPWFVETLGVFYRNSGPYNVTRFVEGESMKNVLPTLSQKEFISIVAQLCVALETAQKEFLFGHYDLHLENIILSRNKTDRRMTFDEYCIDFSNDILPVIIDFGMSCGTKNNQQWGLSGLEHKCIHKQLLSGYDIFCFFLYCHQQVTLNGQVKSVIHVVLNDFFKFDTTTSYVSSLKQNAGSMTPKQLFDFIKGRRWLSTVQSKSRDVLTFNVKLSTSNTHFYIDYVYYKMEFNGNVAQAIQRDIALLTQTNNIMLLLKMYYKILECHLTEQYESWVKSFTPLLNKYWVSKTKYYVKKRLEWRYHVSENANAS